MSTAQPLVELEDVKKDYYLKGETVQALRGITLSIKKMEYLSIMGPSGSGKTTLFNTIGGLARPTSGRILVEGDDLSRLSNRKLAWLRARKIGFIFQTFNLIPVLTALENVAIPMIFLGFPRDQRLEKARELLETVGLGDRVDHLPTELSGGQQQRVAVARALANEPIIILADEPTGNLDLYTGKSIVELLYSLKTRKETTVICATHDLKMIEVSDRIAWLRDGELERIEEIVGVTITADDL